MIDKQLFKLIGKNKKYIFITVAVMVAGLMANISITASICKALYLLYVDAKAEMYIYPMAGALAGIAVRFVTTLITGRLKDTIGRKAKYELRYRTYDKIIRLGEKGADNMSMAGLTQVSMEGIEQLDLYYSSYLPQFFYAMLAPLILFSICVAINWRVSVVLIACVPLIPVSIIMVSKYAKKIFAKYWGKYTSMGDCFLDSVQGLKDLKIFQADESFHNYINEKSEEFRKITMKVLVMQLASITIMDIVAFGGAGVGITFAVKGALNGGNPIAALFLILVAVDFFLPLRALGSAFHVAMNGASAGKKLITLLELPEPVWGSEKVSNTEIRLDDITFSYDDNDSENKNAIKNVIEGVSLEIKPRQLTAIVGESGCGKSTIVGLITGANRAVSGKVTVGGIEIERLSREAYYSKLAVVSYNTYIFNASVRQNFYLTKSGATDEEMDEALKKVNLYDFIMENGGLDKIIMEDANNISGGQRQRLALAVNLIADKEIYIFDEATSNIDIESEAVIMRNIKELSENKSVVLISHRLANVVMADNIYYMEKGCIMQMGTHEELMKQNGGYADIYNAQKQLEEGYKYEQ